MTKKHANTRAVVCAKKKKKKSREKQETQPEESAAPTIYFSQHDQSRSRNPSEEIALNQDEGGKIRELA